VHALETKRNVIPVLLDSAATQNWVWPLVSRRQALTVTSEAELPQVAAQIRRVIEDESLIARESWRAADSIRAAAPPASARTTWSWSTILFAVAAALVGALITLLFVR